jgi:RNA polymerase sigma-70 factor (ECF subfamily)
MIKSRSSSIFDHRFEEDELLIAVRRDPQAFIHLYDRYLEPVYRYLMSRVGNRQDAEDLTSQVFLTAFECIAQYQHREKPFAAWLFTIARNKSIDFFRSNHNEIPLVSTCSSGEDDPLEKICKQDEFQAILNLIGDFPADDREVLQLRFAAEMTYAEIANFLHRNEDAVKKQIYRLLERIEKEMEVTHE